MRAYFRHYEVISRSVGDTTDIVTKEMYDFYDKGDHAYYPRQELLPLSVPMWKMTLQRQKFKNPNKFYMGPMFRYERHEAGRLRQFHQIGVECFGSSNPATDVETIMAAHFLKVIGIQCQKLPQHP